MRVEENTEFFFVFRKEILCGEAHIVSYDAMHGCRHFRSSSELHSNHTDNFFIVPYPIIRDQPREGGREKLMEEIAKKKRER
jgi:hypothetical protein